MDNIGFYSLHQLATQKETKRQKAHEGIFPWGPATIRRMVAEGTFPTPVKGIGRANLWPKKVIHEFIEKIMKEEKKNA